ncbi:MAG: hypothetical protein AAFU57_15905 [Bacteroidota bacterium]
MMKAIFYNYLCAILFLVLPLGLCAQTQLTKDWKRSYDVSSQGTVHIENKYGNVVVNGWDKEQVQIAINVSVSHRKDENAKKLLDRIQPEVTTAGDYVKVSAKILERSSGFFARYFNKANPFDFDKTNVTIDFEVYLPASAELKVTNKFGDVVLASWEGDLEADVQHGDLWINDEISAFKADIRFGKLNCRGADYGNVKMSNGTIDIKSAGKLKIISSGSEIDLGNVSNLEVYSSKDELVVDEVKTLRGDFKFSNGKIHRVGSKLFLTLRVAEVEIGEILEVNPEIDIVQESSEIKIDISGLSFNFEATMEQGLLRVPKSFKNVKSVVTNPGKKIREVSASYGSGIKGDFSVNGIKGIVIISD